MIAPILLLTLGLLTTSCLLTTRPPNPEVNAKKIAESRQNDLIRSQLADYTSIANIYINQAQDAIRSRTDSPRILRNLALWQSQVLPVIAFLTWNQNVKVALVDSVTFAIAHRKAIENVAPGDFLEERQPEALDAAKKIEAEAWKVAERNLSPDDFLTLQEEIGQWLKKTQGRFFGRNEITTGNFFSDRAAFSERFSSSGLLGNMESSLADTTQELSHLNRQVAQLTQMALDTPEVARWNVEAFVYDFIETEYMTGIMSKVDRVNSNLDRMATALDELPSKRFHNIETIRDETVQMIRDEAHHLLNKAFVMAALLVLLIFFLGLIIIRLTKNSFRSDTAVKVQTEQK